MTPRKRVADHLTSFASENGLFMRGGGVRRGLALSASSWKGPAPLDDCSSLVVVLAAVEWEGDEGRVSSSSEDSPSNVDV